MGQYYRAVVQTGAKKCKVFSPSKFVSSDPHEVFFLKLMETSWLPNPYVNAIAKMLYKNPRRVLWCGDYVEEPDFTEIRKEKHTWVPRYKTVWNRDEKGTKVSELREGAGFDVSKLFLVNHSKKEYVDIAKYAAASDSNGWCIHPLPLLVAVGNGRGGGDYGNCGDCSSMAAVGSWAWDELSFEDNAPAGYSEFDVVFKE